jgi:hypothetical protein
MAGVQVLPARHLNSAWAKAFVATAKINKEIKTITEPFAFMENPPFRLSLGPWLEETPAPFFHNRGGFRFGNTLIL